MRKTTLARLRDQRGVAMVTVLFIGAALTAVASAAAFTTIKEFRSSTQDRRSAKALAVAEAGIDRLLNHLKTGKIKWVDIALAGCPASGRYPGEVDHPPLTLPAGAQGSVGEGSYTVRLEVFNPITSDVSKRFAPGACGTEPAYPRYWESPRVRPGWWSGDAQYFVIISTGASASSAVPCPQLVGGACRTVHQVVRIKGTGLPVGIYAKTSADMSGNPSMHDISMITPGNVTGRSQVGFSGIDPYYFIGDFTDWSSMPDTTKGLHVPAAVHAGGSISLGGINGSRFEHPSTNLLGESTNLNCNANRTTGSADPQGTAGQSQWDQSGPGGPISGSCVWVPPAAHAHGTGYPPNSPPPTSRMSNAAALSPQPDLTAEDYAALKATAQTEGMYCSFAGGTTTCRRNGVPWTFGGTVTTGDTTGMPNTFVAYFEYANLAAAPLNTIKWQSSWAPCTDDPATNKQVIIIVRRGHLDISGAPGLGDQTIHGAAIVPDGNVFEAGRVQFEGTIIADTFSNRGASRFRLSECAIRNLPGPWLDVTPYRWVEVDR